MFMLGHVDVRGEEPEPEERQHGDTSWTDRYVTVGGLALAIVVAFAGFIVTTVSIAVAIEHRFSQQEREIAVLQEQVRVMAAANVAQDQAMSTLVTLVNEKLDRIQTQQKVLLDSMSADVQRLIVDIAVIKSQHRR